MLDKKPLPGFRLAQDSRVKVTYQGNVTELLYLESQNTKCAIRMVDKNHYIKLAEGTGEVYECSQINDRSQGISSLRRTMRELRGTINANVIDTKKCRWLTLTYADNMTDCRKIKVDYMHFVKRLRDKIGTFEYIAVREPQSRGAWHLHIILIFDKRAPYIENQLVSDCWKKGFVKIKKLDDVDNVGAYLTAYLTDMEYTEAFEKGILNPKVKYDAKEVEVETETGDKIKKCYIKYARLHMYPPKMNLYSCSTGIKKPVSEYMTEENAQKKISSAKLTFSNAIELTDDKYDFTNVIFRRYYNTVRKPSQRNGTQ